MVICPDCGAKVPKDEFCKNCGAYIANIKEPITTEIVLKEDSSIDSIAKISDGVKHKYCFNCGHELGGDYKFCPFCGYNLKPENSSNNKTFNTNKNKNMILAIILSVFLPGLGQIYLGLDHKGSLFLIFYVLSAILILVLIGFLLVIVIWIWALIDTIISANALNRGEKVEDKIL